MIGPHPICTGCQRLRQDARRFACEAFPEGIAPPPSCPHDGTTSPGAQP